MAARNSGIPALGVYLVKPAWSASIAAALMCSGVSKSGSPAPKPHTSIPSAFIAFALLSIESVSEGVSWAARSEISMSILFDLIQGAATLLATVKVFNQSFKIILLHSHDCHFALRVLNRIGRVRSVDHDCLAEFLDRKSTRLNSSHRCISYAVFCLKKKKSYHVIILCDTPTYTVVNDCTAH